MCIVLLSGLCIRYLSCGIQYTVVWTVYGVFVVHESGPNNTDPTERGGGGDLVMLWSSRVICHHSPCRDDKAIVHPIT